MYFNRRHERTGRLFESTFKAKHIDRHEYASYLTQYIHLNPCELFGDIRSEESFSKLKEYYWSSLPDYLGKVSRFSPLLSKNFRIEVLGVSTEDYEVQLKDLYYSLI